MHCKSVITKRRVNFMSVAKRHKSTSQRHLRRSRGGAEEERPLVWDRQQEEDVVWTEDEEVLKSGIAGLPSDKAWRERPLTPP